MERKWPLIYCLQIMDHWNSMGTDPGTGQPSCHPLKPNSPCSLMGSESMVWQELWFLLPVPGRMMVVAFPLSFIKERNCGYHMGGYCRVVPLATWLWAPKQGMQHYDETPQDPLFIYYFLVKIDAFKLLYKSMIMRQYNDNFSINHIRQFCVLQTYKGTYKQHHTICTERGEGETLQ